MGRRHEPPTEAVGEGPAGAGEGEASPPLSGSTPRRRRREPAIPREARRLKCTISLSVEADERLNTHARRAGMRRSAFVELLINEHCRRYVVQDRGRADAGEDRQEVAA